MIRQIRVILSLVSEGFTSGIRNVISTFGDLGNIVSGIKHAFDLLTSAARTLWDTFVVGVISEERLQRQFSILLGDMGKGAALFEQLRDYANRTGLAFDDVSAAASLIAPALKASEGSVDPARLLSYLDAVKRLALATGQTIPEMAGHLQRAIAGDVEGLARALGLSKEALASMSGEFAKFIQQAQGAQETQLGAVTRLAGTTETRGGDALKMLEELAAGLDSAGIAEEAWAAGSEDSINRFENALDELKDTIGEDLLPVITPLLEDITAFLKDNPKLIQDIVKALGGFSATAWKDLANAFLIIQRVISSPEFRAFLGLLAGGPFTAAPIPSLIGGALPIAGSGSPQPLAQIPGPENLGSILSILANQLAQGIKIKIDVADDGKIVALAEGAASNAIADLVTGASKGKGSKPGR